MINIKFFRILLGLMAAFYSSINEVKGADEILANPRDVAKLYVRGLMDSEAKPYFLIVVPGSPTEVRKRTKASIKLTSVATLLQAAPVYLVDLEVENLNIKALTFANVLQKEYVVSTRHPELYEPRITNSNKGVLWLAFLRPPPKKVVIGDLVWKILDKKIETNKILLSLGKEPNLSEFFKLNNLSPAEASSFYGISEGVAIFAFPLGVKSLDDFGKGNDLQEISRENLPHFGGYLDADFISDMNTLNRESIAEKLKNIKSLEQGIKLLDEMHAGLKSSFAHLVLNALIEEYKRNSVGLQNSVNFIQK